MKSDEAPTKYPNSNRCVEPDSYQCQLTEEIIVANLDAIVRDLRQLRDAIDEAIAAAYTNRYGAKLANLSIQSIAGQNFFHDVNLRAQAQKIVEFQARDVSEKYPIGQCGFITRLACRRIMNGRYVDGLDGIACLREFIARGGHLSVIWGNVRDRYFQTAIQAGSYYFDLANDTVDITKDKVDHAPLEESGFKNITGYADYIKIRKRYHNATSTLNTCFPELFPYCPLFLFAKERNVIKFDSSQYMSAFAVANDFDMVTELLSITPPIPRFASATIQKLSASIAHVSAPKTFAPYFSCREMNCDEMEQRIKTSSELTDEQVMHKVANVNTAVGFINKIWRESAIDVDGLRLM